MKRKKAAAGTGLRATLIVLCTVLALMLTVMLGATIYAEHLLAQMNYVDPNHPRETLSPEEIHAIEHAGNDGNSDFTGPSIDEDDVDWGDQVGTNIGGKDDSNIINILLIGQDRRPGEGTARSDSMILCTFNKSRKTLTMTSFLRDLYLQIPGYKDNRINAAYALGGMSLLNATLEQNFGIRMVPLFIKDIAMGISQRVAMKRRTICLSNVGKIEMPTELAAYAEYFEVFNSSPSRQICMCSYGDNMVIAFSGVFAEHDVERAFFRMIAKFAADAGDETGVTVSTNYSAKEFDER